jgi:hypothetical protein
METARAPVWLEAGLFFFVAFCFYLAGPRVDAGDPHFVIPTAVSLIRHGDANIDEYRGQFAQAYWAVGSGRGHFWNVYPPGVPMLIVPVVWAADKAYAVFGRDLEAIVLQGPPLVLELVCASVITALAAGLMFVYLRARLPLVQALLLAGLFAVGTAAYSSASRGLYPHGPTMLFLTGAILLYERVKRGRASAAWWLGVCAGYSYTIRPANVIVVVGFAVLVFVTARRQAVAYVLGALAGVGPLFVFNLAAFGAWLSPYYRMTEATIWSFAVPVGPLGALLVSPSRGLFVFSPFLLFVGARFLPYFRRRYPFTPVETLLAMLAMAWWFGTSRWRMWWGGASYGPRLLCDLLPCLIVLLAPVAAELTLEAGWKRRIFTVFFIVSGAVSVAIQLRGVNSPSTSEWNQTPVPIDQAPGRVWEWRDPQFLRGAR